MINLTEKEKLACYWSQSTNMKINYQSVIYEIFLYIWSTNDTYQIDFCS